ncbi:nucleoporin complex subunit 54-domain-containing protein [Zychaea mexicana]|uniref:nucleoporin complex subunit 54-domain-containing protein n=1 Tax=Zychaea mexicana TaxID=64656 RepID=UPI0022FE39A4|nr:nucleoporin complex subunit 54-domain-containing protein [Zychaea mexicana]KAI9494809.1 nucleoporin complex subunit 54-domain-containing protein [Zychaea mexicana]
MAFSFGGTSQPSTGFGSTAGTGSAFGATANSSAGTLFGAGTSNTSAAGTLFGAGNSNTGNTSAGTLFGAGGNNNATTSAGTLFGANPGNTVTGGFGAASTSTTAAPGLSSFSSFGNTNTPTSTAGTGFGQQQQQQAGTSSFGFGGQQQQQQPQQQQTSGFGFGANNNNANTTNTGFGGFGANSAGARPTSGFGTGLTNTASTGFGGIGQQQQQNKSQFGGFGSTGFGQPQQQQLQQQQLQQQQQQQPPHNTWQQLALIRAHWDPSSHLCQFRHYFYNVVPPNERHLYVRPPDQDEQLWNEAVRKNPDPNTLVPVLAVGYGDVLKRMDIQDQASEMHRNKLAEIGQRLSTIQQKHALGTLVKIDELRRRNIDLTQRLIKLLRFVQVLRYKGFPLEDEEEKLMQNLKLLAEQPANPEQLNAKLRDTWASLQHIKRKRMAAPEDSWQATSSEDVATIAQLLAQEQEGMRHVSNTLSKDVEEAQNIEESLRNHIKRAERERNSMLTGS